MRTLIIGLGNPILGDDGVGWRVARLLAEDLADDPDVHVIEAALGGLRLVEMTVSYDRVILVDAFCKHGAEPGRLLRLRPAELARTALTQHAASPHDTNILTAMRLGRLLGLAVPEDWVVFAVTIDPVDTFSEKLSPAVARAVPEAADAVRRELDVLAATSV